MAQPPDTGGTRETSSQSENRDQELGPSAEDFTVKFRKGISSVFRLLDMVTIEPIIFFYVYGGALMGPTVRALIYEKVCLNLYNVSICNHLDLEENVRYEDEVQSEASRWYLAENLCFEIPAIVLSPFYGTLSDKVSRKAAILFPVIGQVLSATNYVINSVFMDLPTGFILIGPIISGLFGGQVVAAMACFAVLSDVTTEEIRTKRLAVAESVVTSAVAISMFTGGLLLDRTSFQFVNTLALGFFAVALTYTILWLREPPSASRVRDNDCGSVCQTVCSPDRIKAAVGCVVKKRERNRRAHILVSLGILITGSIGLYADSLIYLFVRKQPLNWSQSLYGYFSGYTAILYTISRLVFLYIFKQKLHMSETNIIIASFVSVILSLLLFSLSTETWMVFIVPLVGMLGVLYGVILRSMISRMVSREEFGRVFAIFGSIQSLNALISALIYNSLYPATLQFWNGFCFVLGAIICIIPISMAVWLGRNLEKYGWESYDTLSSHRRTGNTDSIDSVTDCHEDQNDELEQGDEEMLDDGLTTIELSFCGEGEPEV